MSRFGKTQADQMMYQNEKLKKVNAELVIRINHGFIPALKAALVKMGEPLVTDDTVSNEEYDLKVKQDPETKTTTFFLEKKELA